VWPCCKFQFQKKKSSYCSDKKETLAARKSECCAYKMKKEKYTNFVPQTVCRTELLYFVKLVSIFAYKVEGNCFNEYHS